MRSALIQFPARLTPCFRPLRALQSPAVFTLQLVPAGVVTMVAPAERANFFMGKDTFQSTDPAYLKSLVDTLEAPGIVMEGPFTQLFGIHDQPVLVVRKAIYVHANSANETFGRPNTTNPVCGNLCDYNATSGMAFWGFVSACWKTMPGLKFCGRLRN